jgi:hypothetical protein
MVPVVAGCSSAYNAGPERQSSEGDCTCRNILSGLLVNPIRRWCEENSKSRDVKKADREKEQYFKTLTFMISPEMFTQFLVWSAMRSIWAMGLAIIGVLMPMLLFILFLSSFPTMPAPHSVPHWILILVTLYTLMGAIANTLGVSVLMGVYTSVRGQLKRIKEFDSYLITVPTKIRDQENETRARNAQAYPWKMRS